jgi:hypothetical protein
MITILRVSAPGEGYDPELIGPYALLPDDPQLKEILSRATEQYLADENTNGWKEIVEQALADAGFPALPWTLNKVEL